METVSVKKGVKKKLVRSDLESLTKEELIDKILQIDAHNTQLINIISKNGPQDLVNHDKQQRFDFSKVHTRHILLKIYYLGWDYKGFAVQEDSCETIEHYLFGALVRTCLIKDRTTSNYHRCGRTDKGVSAFSQVISIDVRSKFPPSEQNLSENINSEIDYCKLLNRVLPSKIQCIGWCPVNPEFSARFDCEQRSYKYFFPKANFNIKAMNEAASYLLGTHDFRNLCKMDVANGVTEYIRDIRNVTILPCCTAADLSEHETTYTMYVVTITAKAFLWHQIRCIIAILFLVGEGKEDPIVMKELLDVTKVIKKPQYNMASELPLNLFKCDYKDIDQWIIDPETLQTTINSLQRLWVENSVKSSMIYTMLSDLGNTVSNISIELNQGDLLVPGVKQRTYQPLLERKTCESLEDRIQHFTKKRKLITVESSNG